MGTDCHATVDSKRHARCRWTRSCIPQHFPGAIYGATRNLASALGCDATVTEPTGTRGINRVTTHELLPA